MATERKRKKPTRAELLKLNKNFISIKFDWGKEYVFPYEAGIALMELFEHAEQLKSDRISPILSNQSPSLIVMSEKEYIDKKMSHILDMDIEGE